METWIDTNIARGRRNLRITAVLLLLLVVGTAAVGHRYFLNYLQGPVVMTPDELAKVKSPGELARYWVTVTGDKLVDLGVYEETTTTNHGIETGKSNTAFYGALRIGALDLIVREPQPIVEAPNVTLTGSLEELSSDERTSVLLPLQGIPNAAPTVFKIDTSDFRRTGTILLAIGAALVLIALMLMVKSRDRGERENYKLVQDLAAFGDPHTLALKVDAELTDPKARFGVTPSFAFWRTGYGGKIIPTQDLIWSFVRTGKAPGVIHHLRNGKTVQQGMPRKLGQQMLQQLAARAPWVLIGYDKRFITGWAKDRANLIAAVDHRRMSPPAK